MCYPNNLNIKNRYLVMSQIKQQTITKIWSKAKQHYKASSVGLPGDMEKYELCECCDQAIVKDPISMWEHTKEFQVFGFGYPLWFSFLKYCIILVLVLVASRTGSSIYMATKENYDFCYGDHGNQISAGHQKHFNSFGLEHELKPLRSRHFGAENGHDNKGPHSPVSSSTHVQTPHQSSHSPQSAHGQHHAECTSFMIYLSIFKGEEAYNNQFLRILSFVIHIIALVGIRNNLEKQEQYYDERTCSLSDYSVIVRNLPQVYGVRDMVLKMFKQEFNKTYGKGNSQIQQLLFVFEDQQLQKLEKQKHHLEQERLKAIERNDQRQAKQKQQEIQKLQKQFKTEIQKVAGNIKRDKVKCDKMIVILNSEDDKGQVLQMFEQQKEKGNDFAQYFGSPSTSNLKVKPKIEIREAPEPNEINWQHIDESDTARSVLILKGWLFTFLFLAVVTVIFYFIMLAKTNLFVHAIELQHHDPLNQTVKRNKIFATIIVFVALFGVILFNKFIMGKVLYIFVHMQRHAYTDTQGHSFAMKYSLGMFFTTALMTLAVEAITFKNFYSHQYGVIEEQTIMFFVTAFFIPLVWIIHPYNLAKKIELYFNQNKLVNQQKANELIEDFPYDLGKRYAEVFEIMWFTFLYSELIPLGSFLVLIGLFLYYWVDKFNFLRRSALKGGVSGKMSLLSLKSLDATLFLAPAGRVLFRFIIQDQVDYLGIILTIMGLIYLILPISKMIWTVNGQKFILEEKTYVQALHSFKQHYYTLHPVYKLTHKDHNRSYRQKVREHYKEEYKKIKLYSSGRGTFAKEEQSPNHSKLIAN